MLWDQVVRIGARLPAVDTSTSYGTPALKVAGKLLTRLRTEDDSLVFLDVPVDERDLLIEAAPDIFHTTPHYAGSATVLARLATVSEGDVWRLLHRRWQNVAPRRLVATYAAGRVSDRGS